MLECLYMTYYCYIYIYINHSSNWHLFCPQQHSLPASPELSSLYGAVSH